MTQKILETPGACLVTAVITTDIQGCGKGRILSSGSARHIHLDGLAWKPASLSLP